MMSTVVEGRIGLIYMSIEGQVAERCGKTPRMLFWCHIARGLRVQNNIRSDWFDW